jgi:hypothetical protein
VTQACIGLVLACFAPAQAERIPFERLGRALIAAADERRGGEPSPEDAARAEDEEAELRFLRRIEPAFRRIDLGGVEVWWPDVEVDCHGKLEPPPPIAGAVPVARAAVRLESFVCDVALEPSVEIERAKPAFARLEAWVESLGARGGAETSRELAADRVWVAERFQRVAPSGARSAAAPKYGIVLLLAPDRAQYFAVIGAAGAIDAERQASFWHESFRRAAGTALFSRSCLVPFATGPERAEGPYCEAHALPPADRTGLAMHTLAHSLVMSVAPCTPPWFAEGFALCGTIHVAGADETLCTGANVTTWLLERRRVVDPALGPSDMLAWVTREASPYRGGASSHWFAAELADAWDAKRGFEILDLEQGKVATHERGPFFGARAVVSLTIASASNGVKQGYAEFFRAYCGAFVEHLYRTKIGEHSALAAAFALLRTRDPTSSKDVSDALLAELAHGAGRRSEDGESPADSVERVFVAWLTKRR